MRFSEVFRFEFGYRLTRLTTWIYFGMLFLLSTWIFLATSGEGGQVHDNSPERLAEAFAIAGTFGMLVTASLFADAALRDLEVGMDPLLFTTRLTKRDYLAGRFLAALAVNVILTLAIPAGFLFATWTIRESPQFGPFRPLAYVQPFILLVLPNTLLAGSVLFAIAMWTRKSLAVYLGAVAMLISYIVAANYRHLIENPALASLADPFAMAALSDFTRSWTTIERNTQLVGFPAIMLQNRIAWLTVAVAFLFTLYRTYRFAHVEGTSGRRRDRQSPEPMLPTAKRVVVPRVSGQYSRRTRAQQALAVARHSFEEMTDNWMFRVGVLLAIGFTLLWGWNVGTVIFETASWPVTHLVATVATKERITPLLFLIIAIFSGEIVWRDRDAHVAEIADAAPVSTGVSLIGRFLAILVIMAIFQAAFVVGGIIIQVLQGYYRFEFDLYLAMYLLRMVDLVLFIALAITIHVIVNQKYLGHMVVLIALVFTMVYRNAGLEHHLLVYSTAPAFTYSDMNGFGSSIIPTLWFKLYWSAWALMLAVLTNLLLVRGKETGWYHRLRLARERFGGATTRTAAAASVLIAVIGGYIYYNTNVLNEYRSGDSAGIRQAEYERKYGRFETLPQPVIESADLRMEIYTDKPGVDISGTYRLVNRTDTPIDSVHVYIPPTLTVRSVTFDRGATLAVADEDIGYSIHALPNALQPGDSLQMSFELAMAPRGFTNDGVQTDVRDNTARFDRRWLPVIGYQRALELQGDAARKRFGLPLRPMLPPPQDPQGRMYRNALRDADRVWLSAIIGTASDQMAITPGVLKREWTENGRRYFHYESQSPRSFGVNVYAGKWSVVKDRWKDVELRIYHHPDHPYVLDNVRRSMKASLAYFSEQFGAYPDKQLSLVEFPRYGGYGIAHAATVGFSEDYFIGRVQPGDVDLPFYGMAHEIAHQWWGGMLRGAMAQGHGYLSESLANYSAMILMDRVFGADVARRVYDFQMERYIQGRAVQAREVPLLLVEDQPYINYRKGAIAMMTLRDHVGEVAVNGALRRYVDKYRNAGPPFPTSYDLFAELKAVTPDSLQYLLKDLFETVTLWDVRTDNARVDTLGNGTYRVSIDVVGKKVTADSIGRETEVPMNDLVEIAVFAANDTNQLGTPVYLQRHRIRSGKQTIVATVNKPPVRAGVDPFNRMIDRRREDNLRRVGAGGKAGPAFSAREANARYALSAAPPQRPTYRP